MPPPKPKLLAVEDNPETRILLRYLLQDQFEVLLAATFDEALRLAQEATAEILLLDINLGETRTGVDLLRELRTKFSYRDTPAIAFTAYARPEDRHQFLESGFDEYLTKPFTRKQLLEAIAAALYRRRS
ncbi:response regulator [Rhodothermus bifroesti]|uniref:Response regulator n=1 Tax=Rhodothermus marinus TaxID=29549 RepID=A0A7V2F6D8_RHOMR|nr:response regulator [Rhodothermus bifroesti]GBD00765.1 Phosphate regulon transcriptional regulatory protein PhoB [bacterium HR18]